MSIILCIYTMDHFKEKIIKQCLTFMKREDVKDELKNLMRPMIDMILQEIYPYLYISLIFLSVNFILILGIFVILLRNFYKSTIFSVPIL
jgi:hypothetical protein